MRLLHFSDVHLQLPRWRERSLRELGPLRALASVELWKGRGRDYDDAAGTLRQIVRDAANLKADHCILTGDLTQLAHEEEFALAREILAPLFPRLTVIPGNHDRYPINGKPNRLYEQYFPEFPLAPRALGGVALFPIDSAGELSWPVISHGRFARGALHQLSADLHASQAACKLVLVHHAPSRSGRRLDWPLHDLRGASALLRACAEAGAQAILCGHLHQRFDDQAQPGRARVICAGSSTERGHEGYWLLDVDQGQVSASRHKPGGASD